MLSVVLATLVIGAPIPQIRPKEPVQIDLASAYSTVEKMGQMKLARTDKSVHHDVLEEVHAAARHAGLSSAFLVAGKDFGHVALATASVFGGGLSAKEVVRRHGLKNGDIWVCAFLGNSSTTPPAFSVQRIEVAGQTVRVVFAKPRSLFRSADHAPFLIWANLGQLPPGKYSVELVDADQDNEVVVARKVTVKPTEK